MIPTGRALVPGCGRGYDVTALASSDRFAVGLELSETAIQRAEERLQSLTDEDCSNKAQCKFVSGSFFDLNPSKDPEHQFDFVYDYTFLCALDPSIRVEWANKMFEIIKPSGVLLTLIYPISDHLDGPPFAVNLQLVKVLLESVGFECLELRMLPDELCHTGREGKSGVGRWLKKESSDDKGISQVIEL